MVIILFFLLLFVTERCGLNIKCFTKSAHFGIQQTQRHARRTSAVDDFTVKHNELKMKEASDPFASATGAGALPDPFAALSKESKSVLALAETQTAGNEGTKEGSKGPEQSGTADDPPPGASAE